MGGEFLRHQEANRPFRKGNKTMKCALFVVRQGCLVLSRMLCEITLDKATQGGEVVTHFPHRV